MSLAPALESGLRIMADVAWMLAQNAPWMGWNLFLAFVPLYLAARLFRRPAEARIGRPAWWLGAAVFLAFLPNALYVLTDLIHLYHDVPAATTNWRMAFAIVPQYLIFCALGFGAYVVSLIWLGRMLLLRGWSSHRVLGVEILVHLACSVGVYLGRFVRFNTWDLLARPEEVAATIGQLAGQISPLGFIGVFFIATCMLYWPAKHVTIALVTYVRTGAHRTAPVLVQRYL